MFQENILLQTCALMGLIASSILLTATFIPKFNFEHEIDQPNPVRAFFLIVILGLLRGAF